VHAAERHTICLCLAQTKRTSRVSGDEVLSIVGLPQVPASRSRGGFRWFMIQRLGGSALNAAGRTRRS